MPGFSLSSSKLPPSPSTRRFKSPKSPSDSKASRADKPSPTSTRDGEMTLAAFSHDRKRDAAMDRRASHPPPPASSTSVSMRPATQGSASHGKEDTLVPQQPRRSASDDPASMASTAASANPTSQQQLSDYREKLARDLERRELSARGLLGPNNDKSRISPIQEEAAFNSPLLNSGLTTTSTESGNTIRGGITPAPIAGTPSYPFPRMGYPGFNYGYMPSSLHRPFTTLSPTGAQDGAAGLSRAQDKVLSGNTTPASNATFFPSGASPFPENFDFPAPNLYDLSLMLSAEPGLDAWWNTVVHIMKDVYRAERVTLSVPADATDIENVPWGQKATYNEHQEDELSLGYMARASSAKRSSDPDLSDVLSREDLASPRLHARPGMHSRHSFTSFEDNKEREQDQPTQGTRRPSNLTRSRSHLTTSTDLRNAAEAPQLDSDALEEHDAEVVQAIPSWEEPLMARNQGKGRLLPVLQALDYEADPLIDHSGVMRVLERGTTVALTRSYPYLSNPPPPETQAGQSAANKTSQTEGSSKGRKRGPEPTPNLASILSGSSTRSKRTGPSEKSKTKGSRTEEDAPKVSTPNYEEFEQAPPSPWSQSPAPSPAVRPDPTENPFFTDATVDEDSFNPGSAPADYAGMRPPEAIGVENSWTVLHIPLSHVLLSSAPPPFRLDPSAMESRSANASKQGTGPDPGSRDTASPIGGKRAKATPIAILSILSPFIPYPSSLRHSLEHLAPHMATSFSLCRHYSNLETELAGMQRRRPPTTGFGAVAPDGRPLDTTIFVTSEDIARQQSLPGSMTSPSDYSGVSKSVTGSPAGTPGWDHGSFSYIMDKRNVASPAAVTGGGESYFSSKQKSNLNSSGPSRSGSKDTSPSEKKTSRPSTSKAVTDLGTTDETPEIISEEALDGLAQGTRTTYHQDLSEPSATTFAVTPSGEHLGEALRLDRLAQQAGHTKLHSYGADFASTFQSLPPSSTVSTRPTMPLSRPSSFAPGPADMPPPSDRLKGLILDSLPAHVFVALPQSGEIVWVNSRFLSYRGQTVSDLAVDPWGSIHADDRGEYLKAWSHSLRTGEQFSRTVRIKRFDGAYRWFYARAVASKDKRGVIMQFLGSYMDIHDQHIAELKAARQEEIAASNAKHHLLANLIPQIIFTATEEDGITFANEQWLSYTGQSLEDSLGLGFMDFVHPEDLARCRIPVQQPGAPSRPAQAKGGKKERETSSDTASTGTVVDQQQSTETPSSRTRLQSLSRENSSGSSSIYEMTAADLTELARSGVIKVGTDSDGRPSYTTEVRLRSKSGEYRWHLIRCVEIDTIDFGSGASSYFGSATDINDHKLLEAKLKEAMESKGRFLSNMSHEIRTPLIGISGMVTFLQDTKLNDEQLDYTNTIQTSANSLIMIINDILDLSKVDAGMMKLNYEWFHARSLIEDVNELVSTMAIAKRLELNYLVESDVPAWVKGDKVRIRQVLLNVIGNAIKFTSEGEVFSHCKVLQTEDHETGHPEIALQFSVIDTGRGFSEEEAALIFKPFSQIDTSSTRQHGGSGLGLVISKQLVELHGGHMEGKAVLGKGSTFTFSARFGLPTLEDHPHQPGSPNSTMYSAASRQLSTESVPGSIKPLPAPKHLRNTAGSSPSGTDLGFTSPDVTSTGSSEPSVHSARSHVTDRSSNTSVNTGLARFSEAAKASGQDITHMKLEMPSEKSSPGGTATPATHGQLSPEEFRPPMYSILIICPQLHSREATGQHIETTLPKDVPRQITALGSVEEAQKFIGGDDPINFTHIVINLPSPETILSLLEQIATSQKLDKTAVLILSDSVQRQEVMKLAADSDHEEFLSENLVNFIYKPVKPSRFAVIFDPNRERDVSIDRNKSTAQQLVEAQKASYEEIQRLVVNKGHRVLLVEDNPVNQKVLLKYLQKIGVGVDVAVDGVECTDKVLSKPHKHYSLILCDLHMPRKDGYQTCREIRQWERVAHYPKMPIIALSADVLADVQHKCVAAGFSDYVAKPVDFIELGKAMIQVFDPKAQPRIRN